MLTGNNEIKYLTDEEVKAKISELGNTLSERLPGVRVSIMDNRQIREPERCRRSFLAVVGNQIFEIREAHNGQFWYR